MRDARALAASLWLLLAFLVWNVRFDYGIRVAAAGYVNARTLHVRGLAPPIEMASTMRAARADSAGAASAAAVLPLATALWIGATAALRSAAARRETHRPPTAGSSR
jgi:hypothetical protein